MAFFRGNFADPSFTPLFRLLNDFDAYSREVQGEQEPQAATHNKHRGHTHAYALTPKFDLYETPETYELHGELPGVDKENITIEFTDPHTMMIRGHVERTYTSGTPPAGLVGNGKKKSAITEGGEKHNNSHKARVEDDPESAPKNDQVVRHTKDEEKSENGEAQTPAHRPAERKFWVSERSFGQFARAFTFPTRVDRDNIRAQMKDGVLNVSVPKEKKTEATRIPLVNILKD